MQHKKKIKLFKIPRIKSLKIIYNKIIMLIIQKVKLNLHKNKKNIKKVLHFIN